ncbi:MAG: methylated-DNA--[protein]-cysteine S-methyltransferase [Deltaproteobacteria bacterium]|nr:MAG: methylated-DNA--[protein]-cysteine S-methyltransferase [Deltaproteobacteria bacterium]TMB40466.1 MAG: methylated-DNA--[protein]-cysteine S-methyltransferase [Deltaproteobacteria bacterium]
MISEKQVIDRLAQGFAASSATDRLRLELAAMAEQQKLLDVSYRTVDSPLGTLLLAATGKGLVRVAFNREDHESVLARLATDISPRILRTPRRLDEAARQLEEYFAGKRRAFTVPVDLQLAHGFRRSVLLRLREIPYGRTQSYAAVAKAAGNPSAVRAAASACSHNPLPLVVPCHRVVRSDGALGEYLGGPRAKHALLALEAGA